MVTVMIIIISIIIVFVNGIFVNYKAFFKYEKRKVINETLRAGHRRENSFSGVQTHPRSFRPLRISGLEERSPQKKNVNKQNYNFKISTN